MSLCHLVLESAMVHPNFIILYVSNPAVSAEFYAALLERPPIEASPTFAMLALESGAMLGLWHKDRVEPTADASAGAVELAFSIDSNQKVDAIHADWQARGLRIIQHPVTMDFGYTFVALDPDGHRLRVFAASGQ
jgi:predicted lactoylglutathione lyase